MTVTILEYLLAVAGSILIYLCGRAHGMAAGFRKGRDLWRPAYYRVYRQYLAYHQAIGEGLLDVVSDSLKPFVLGEIARVETEISNLSDLPEVEP